MHELTRLAGAALCVGVPGDVPDPATLATLGELGPGGVALFGRNVSTLAGTRAYVEALRAALPGTSEPLVCVDQEGGRVARLRFEEALPSMLALGATGDAVLAERAGRRLGCELAAIGANVDFAPVLDLALAADATAIGTRAFGDDPVAAARLGAALVRGLQGAGVAATAKHFPSHGESTLDPHLDFPTRATPPALVRTRDLPPFAAAFAAGALAVMSAHAVLAQVADVPATLSPAIMTTLLRDELRFAGVAFTDCLQMDAIARGVGTARGAVLALAAGADVLTISHDLPVAFAARDAIVAAVTSGELPRRRLEEAVARADALRAELARRRPLRDAARVADDASIAREIARAAIVRVRGDARLRADRPVTVVSFEGGVSDGIAAQGERPSLSLALRRRRLRSESFRVAASPDGAMREMLLDVLDAERAQGERALVVLARRAHLAAAQRSLIDELLARDPAAIAVSALEPFDVPALAGARTVYATCGDDETTIDALADVLTGRAEARGTLPIARGALA